jgi:YVTN family beta-propeller protein
MRTVPTRLGTIPLVVVGVTVALLLPALAAGLLVDPSPTRAPAGHPPIRATLGEAQASTTRTLESDPSNESSLLLYNDTLLPGNIVPPSGQGPTLSAFDSLTDEVLAIDPYSDQIDVVSGVTNALVGMIPLAGAPDSVAYDAGTNAVAFGLADSDLVGLANGTSGTPFASTNISASPLALATDPANGVIFVVGLGAAQDGVIAELNGTTGALLANIALSGNETPVGGGNGLAYDPSNGLLYAPTDPLDALVGTPGNLSVVDPETGMFVGTVPLSFEPSSVLFVPSSGDLLLGNAAGDDLAVFDPSTTQILTTVPFPGVPGVLAWDGAQGEVDAGSPGNLSFIDPATEIVNHTARLFGGPDGLVDDPEDDAIYVSDASDHNVSVLNGTSGSVVASILVGALPEEMALDPDDGRLFVGDALSDQVIAVNATSDRVTASYPMPTGDGAPFGLVYDPVRHEIAVESDAPDVCWCGRVTFLDPSNGTVAQTTIVNMEPWAIAYDAATGDLYVTGTVNATLDVLNASTGNLTHRIAVGGHPGPVAVDPVSGYLFVGQVENDTVTIVNASAATVLGNSTVGLDPYGITVDGTTGRVFVSAEFGGNITALGPRGQETGLSADPNDFPIGLAFDPDDGEVYVAGSGTNSVLAVNATTGAVDATLPTGTDPTAVVVDPANGAVSISDFASGSLTFLTVGPPIPSFPVTFEESGLPTGTPWAVVFDGRGGSSPSANITFTAANGTVDAYAIIPPSGFNATPANGAVMLTGQAVTVAITFRHVVGPELYAVEFVETGLSPDTIWSVSFVNSIRSSENATILFLAANATELAYTVYPIGGFRVHPSDGLLNVTGAPVDVPIAFSPIVTPTYAVTFLATGLPSGDRWAISLGAATNASTNDTIGFEVENDSTDPFTVVSGPGGFTASPRSGALDINGNLVEKTIAWSALPPPQFRVTILETGLPVGTLWSSTLNGSPESSTTPTIAFTEPNGSYLLTVSSVFGYAANVSATNLTVAGHAVQLDVGFASSPGSVGPSGGAPFTSLSAWEIGAALLGIGVLIALALILRGRRPREPAPEVETPSSESPE